MAAGESAPAVIESDTLILLGLNVAHARDAALNQIFVTRARHRKNLDNIAALMRDVGAHVVALQEADGPSLWSGSFDHVLYLSQIADYPSFVHGRHADSWIYTYGAALLSRTRMDDTQSRDFPPSWPTTTKGFVRGTIQWRPDATRPEVRTLTVVSVHLDFSRKSVRKEQAEVLVNALNGITGPVIVLGDFNADWSEDESPIRMLATSAGLRAYRPAAQGLGTYKGVERLDWVLISDELEFVDYTVRPDRVSDHLAVVAKVGWKNRE